MDIPWIDHAQTEVVSSYQPLSLSSIYLNLTLEMCRNNDNSHFEKTIANNESELIEEYEIEYDDSDDEENDSNVRLNIKSIIVNENKCLNLFDWIPEFDDLS